MSLLLALVHSHPILTGAVLGIVAGLIVIKLMRGAW